MANNFAIGVAGLFQLGRTGRIELKLSFDVVAFGVVVHWVSQVSLAPRIYFADLSAKRPHKRANFIGGSFAFLFAGSAA